jgi:alanine racemase
MEVSRRTFLQSVTASAASLAPATRLLAEAGHDSRKSGAHRGEGPVPDRFDPWIEVLPANLAHNATTLRQLGGSPILAVIKNDGYGLDYRIVARLLEPRPEIEGFALVRADEALTLRQQGVRKPILLMARVTDGMMKDLVAHDVTLAVYADDDPSRLARLGLTKPTPVHAYIDTGMSRMGIRYDRAIPLLRALANVRQCRVTGTFMTFTEDAEFDREQLSRFQGLTRDASSAGLALGKLHAASSHSIFHHRDVGFDLLRPGMSLFGGYPDKFDEERPMADLRPAFRLCARVVRTDRLRPGDRAVPQVRRAAGAHRRDAREPVVDFARRAIA